MGRRDHIHYKQSVHSGCEPMEERQVSSGADYGEKTPESGASGRCNELGGSYRRGPTHSECDIGIARVAMVSHARLYAPGVRVFSFELAHC